MERLNKLIDFFSITENVYVQRELELLKIEIDILIKDAKIETLKDILKKDS